MKQPINTFFAAASLWLLACLPLFANVTNNPTLAISGLPGVGTNSFTTNDFVVGDNWQGPATNQKPATVKFPLSALPNYVSTNLGIPGMIANALATNLVPASSLTSGTNSGAFTLAGSGNVINTGFNPYSQGQFRTPPKGVNGWLGGSPTTSETNVIGIASNLWANGYVANGYNTILIDVGVGQSDGAFPYITNLVAYAALTNSGWLDFIPQYYPHGASNTIAQCHAYGCKVFLYAFNGQIGNSIWPVGGTNVAAEIMPGYFGSSYWLGWLTNAIQNWGLDGLKDEISGGNYTNAILEAQAIATATKKSGRPFYLSVASYGGYQPWYRGLFNSWRVCVGVSGDEIQWTNMYAGEDNMPYWVGTPGTINEFDEMVYPVTYWDYGIGDLYFRNELAFDSAANTALLAAYTGLPERYKALQVGQWYDYYDNPQINGIDNDFSDYMRLTYTNALLVGYQRGLADGSQMFLYQNRSSATPQSAVLQTSNAFPAAPFVTVWDIFRNAPQCYATNAYTVNVGTNDVSWFKLLPGSVTQFGTGSNVLTFIPWATNNQVATSISLLMSPTLNYPPGQQYWAMPNSWRQAGGGVTNTTAIVLTVQYTNAPTWFVGGQSGTFSATVGGFPAASFVQLIADGNVLSSLTTGTGGTTTNWSVPFTNAYNLTVFCTNTQSGGASVYLGDPAITIGSPYGTFTNLTATVAGLTTVNASTVNASTVNIGNLTVTNTGSLATNNAGTENVGTLAVTNTAMVGTVQASHFQMAGGGGYTPFSYSGSNYIAAPVTGTSQVVIGTGSCTWWLWTNGYANGTAAATQTWVPTVILLKTNWSVSINGSVSGSITTY